MRVPIRKAGPFTNLKPDPNITEEKLAELKNKLEKLKTISRPREITEVKRMAAMGDFSENAGYQIAKGRLRGINKKITELEDLIGRATIIKPKKNNSIVDLGNFVTVSCNQQEKTYQILGSVETDPAAGIISYQSPLGKALFNQAVGSIVKVKIADKLVEYKIVKIT